MITYLLLCFFLVIVIMNKNPESYYFEYTALAEKFNTYLPIAQPMFKSLSILN
jgi:hypothetical protein